MTHGHGHGQNLTDARTHRQGHGHGRIDIHRHTETRQTDHRHTDTRLETMAALTCRFCNPASARIVYKAGARRRKRRPIRVRKRPGGEARELNARLIRKRKIQGGSCGDQGRTPFRNSYPAKTPSRQALANPFWLSNLNIPISNR